MTLPDRPTGEALPLSDEELARRRAQISSSASSVAWFHWENRLLATLDVERAARLDAERERTAMEAERNLYRSNEHLAAQSWQIAEARVAALDAESAGHYLDIYVCPLGHVRLVFHGMTPLGGCGNAMSAGICRRPVALQEKIIAVYTGLPEIPGEEHADEEWSSTAAAVLREVLGAERGEPSE